LRPAAERYLAWLLSGRERARRIGERPLKDHTIEQRLAVLSQFATHLDHDGVRDWATCSRAHIEAFLAAWRDRGFRLAAARRVVSTARSSSGLGSSGTLPRVRTLIHRSTDCRT
jgi:site-specific recombinase XerD